MAKIDYFFYEFGSTLPLLHHSSRTSGSLVFHTNNSKIQKYFSSKGIDYSQDMHVGRDSTKVIIGSSREPNLYSKIINDARLYKIKSELYFDSWVNYELRIKDYPDSILVSDSWAYENAKLSYPWIPVTKVPNYFVEYLRSNLSEEKEYVLYLDSPENEYNNLDSMIHPGNCVCVVLSKIEAIFSAKIRVRRHPGYSESDCLNFLKSRIEISDQDIEYDFSKAIAVIGPVSQLHFYAENIGIPSFTIPDPNRNWLGPRFRSLQHLITK